MKPTLLVLAAGMGSRYGGLKQIDTLGPSGETIMDYSVYDALKAGFGKIVFIIRKSFEKDFTEKVVSKYKGKVQVELVFQELDCLPEGYVVPEGREKPWGTNHAVLMGKKVINEPFAVINADDFYGRDGFAVLAAKLKEVENAKGHYFMVGYNLENTLSEGGYVSRGVCSADDKGFLTEVVERTHVERKDGKVQYQEADGWHEIAGDTPVSMNMWGFTPEYFEYSEEFFKTFLDGNKENIKAEFYIPTVVDKLITSGTAEVKVLKTDAKWFGVTYPDDRDFVVQKLKDLVDEGVYPSPLW